MTAEEPISITKRSIAEEQLMLLLAKPLEIQVIKARMKASTNYLNRLICERAYGYNTAVL